MTNVCVLQGRLANDPELRTTPNGAKVTTFTIACNTYGREKTDFIDVVAWRNTAEFISKYFKKGQMILLTGTIQTRIYEDKNGNKRKIVEVVANTVDFCGDKKDKEENNANEKFEEVDLSSDLPF